LDESGAEEVPGEEEDVGGALGEAAHEIGEPGFAIGDIEAHAEALCEEAALEVAADAVEHLKLKLRRGKGEGGGDHALVVGGDGGAVAFGEEELGQGEVVGVDGGFFTEGEGGGLEVSALAEADREAELIEAVEVAGGAEEIGLEDSADAAEFFMKAGDDGEGGVDVLARLHVEFDMGAHALGAFDEEAGVLEAEIGVDVETELGELDGDGGGEGEFFDFSESGEVLIAALGGFSGIGDTFAEVIEGDEVALLVEAGADRENLGEGVAGDEAPGEALGEGRGFHPAAEGFPAREGDKERAEHDGEPYIYCRSLGELGK